MRGHRRAATGFLILLVATAARADNPSPTSPTWKFDTVYLKDGQVLRGLLGEETPRGVRFTDVRQRRGRPTFLIETVLRPGEVARVDRLGEDDRKVLAERLQQVRENDPAAE